MRQDVQDLCARLEDFSVEVIRLVGGVQRSHAGRHVAGQLLRSGTSPAANYEEACGAESRADFVHKLQIALKELREAHYWLRISSRAALVPSEDARPLVQEARELSNIIAKSVITAKRNAVAAGTPPE